MNELISYIHPFGVEKLESTPPKLEDLFMRHYKTSGEGVL